MTETIYLAVDRSGVKSMTKRLPALSRGQIPVKLTLTISETAFREPIIEKEVVIEDWRQGIDIADIEFKEGIITEEEAEMIRSRRLEKMKEILQQQGYSVNKEENE